MLGCGVAGLAAIGTSKAMGSAAWQTCWVPGLGEKGLGCKGIKVFGAKVLEYKGLGFKIWGGVVKNIYETSHPVFSLSRDELSRVCSALNCSLAYATFAGFSFQGLAAVSRDEQRHTELYSDGK